MVSFVERLDPAALHGPTAASEWNVAAVLSHLGSAAEIGRNTLISGKADLEAAPSIWDRWNALTPEGKADAFVESDAGLVEAYEALSPQQVETRMVDVGFLPEPVAVGFIAAMRLGEVGLHRWDIEVMRNPAATVASYVAAFPLAQLPLFAGFFAKPHARFGRVAITTTDPAGTFVLDISADAVTLAPGGGEATTQLVLPAEALLRLSAGRLGADHTPSSVSIAGDISLDDLRSLFPGY